MVATKEGNQKIRDMLLARNPNYFREIGSKGGTAKVPKGFSKMPKAKIRAAGAKGGTISRRRPSNG